MAFTINSTGRRSAKPRDRHEESKADDARTLAFAFCQGTPLRNELEARDPSRLDEITNHVAEEISRTFGPGPITGKMRAHVVTAVK